MGEIVRMKGLKTFAAAAGFFIALAGAYGLGGVPALALAFGALVFVGIAIEEIRAAVAPTHGR
ncbi:MAG: hypothetical protein KGJ66_04270 [Alphaproteobacteria bacterium]|nr:hypothetical protein [Alphaproteobacteria bacterium]